MTMTMSIKLAVALVGLLVYLFASGKFISLKSPGLVAWGVGLLTFLLDLPAKTLHL